MMIHNQTLCNSNRKFDWSRSLSGAANRLLFFRNQVGTSEPTIEAQYCYDSGGNRVMKAVRKQGGDFEFRIYIDGVFEYFTNETDEQNTIHIMDDKSRIATVRIGAVMGDSTPAIKYVLENNIGSSVFTLDDTGANVNHQEYYPFGETSFGSYGKKRYQYVGKERDEESGLYYYGARYYTPWIARFISVDPKAPKFASSSPYMYANNNPLIFNDPTGEAAVLAAVGSALVTAAQSVAESVENAGEFIVNTIQSIGNKVEEIVNTVVHGIEKAYSIVKGTVENIGEGDGKKDKGGSQKDNIADNPNVVESGQVEVPDGQVAVFTQGDITKQLHELRAVEIVGESNTKPFAKSTNEKVFEISGSLKFTQGKLGINVDLLGVDVGGSYDFGSKSQTFEISVSLSTAWTPDIRFTHIESLIESGGYSLELGSVGGETYSEKSSTTTISLQDGFVQEKGVVYKTIESGSIGPIEGNSNGEFTFDPDFGIEVNALILGVGAKAQGKVR